MTEKELAANRKNALKSTGPKTPAGKKRASMNSLKHGLRSVSLAVPILENPKVSRYETHLERSLFRSLHELQRLQEQRLGHPVPPPMALDMNVSQEAS